MKLGRSKWFANAKYRGFDAGKKVMVRCFAKGYGSMPNRRKWFDAESKGMVRCWIEEDGSLL